MNRLGSRPKRRLSKPARWKWTSNLESADESIRLCDGRLARIHEQIAQHDATVTQSRHRSHELEEAVHRYRQQLAAMTGRVGDVQDRLRDTTTALDAAEQQQRDVRDRVAAHERRLSETITQLDRGRSETESRRTQYVERMRQVAILGNRVSGLESQLAAQQASETRIQQRLAELLGITGHRHSGRRATASRRKSTRGTSRTEGSTAGDQRT